jgi:hypothetical protein
MLFHDPDTLHVWINVFLAVAAACVAFAFVALSVGFRRLLPAGTAASPSAVAHTAPVTEPARRAA